MRVGQKRICMIFMIIAGALVLLSYPVFKMDFVVCKQLLYAYLFVSFAMQAYETYLKKSKLRYAYYLLMSFVVVLSVLLWK